MRVAVIGGDGRAERRGWPEGLRMTFYTGEKWGSGDLKRLVNALAAGKVDVLVILTRWIGHGTSSTAKQAARCRVINWDRSIGELSRQLPDLVAGARAA